MPPSIRPPPRHAIGAHPERAPALTQHVTRSVFAIDLPGYGLSERSDRRYAPRLMTDALHKAAAQIRARCGAAPQRRWTPYSAFVAILKSGSSGKAAILNPRFVIKRSIGVLLTRISPITSARPLLRAASMIDSIKREPRPWPT